MNGERESFGEEFREALGDLLAARKTSEHGTRAWNTARDLAGGPGNLLPPAAAAAAKERAEGLGDYEDELNIALADARGLLEATAGSVDPAREVLEAAVEEITAAEQKAPSAAEPSRSWLRSWEEILAEPEPEGGDWLVEDLLGRQSLGAVQGFAKTAKTWVVLELATAIVMGRPAFGRFEVSEPGPVIVVLEESPAKMTRKRLDALGRGHNVLHGKPGLYVSSNERVRLGPDDDGWRERIREMAKAIRPRAIFLDPLVRIKGEEVDENEQKEISAVLHVLADLRDEFTCATVFAHHTGHADKRRFRGSSDLEAFWSDKIALEETGGGKHRHLQAFHRDAPPSEKYEFRLAWRPGDGDDARRGGRPAVEEHRPPGKAARPRRRTSRRVEDRRLESGRGSEGSRLRRARQTGGTGAGRGARRGLVPPFHRRFRGVGNRLWRGSGSHAREPRGTGTAGSGSTERKRPVPGPREPAGTAGFGGRFPR